MHFIDSLTKESPEKELAQKEELASGSNRMKKKIKRLDTVGTFIDNEKIFLKQYMITPERFVGKSIEGYTTIQHVDNKTLYFEGEYKDSKKHGFGIEYSEGHEILYEGFYKQDKFEGWGKTPCYEGEFKNGIYDGFGIYYDHTKYYEGYFKDGEFNGEGICFEGANMIKFHPVRNIHQFLDQSANKNMDILEKYHIDLIFVGQWSQGKRHGFGKLWKKSYWYSGQFAQGILHGLGAEQDEAKKKGVVQTVYRLGQKIEK